MKKIEYFKASTLKDFKTSKEFWKFHSKNVKIKSHACSNILPNSLRIGDHKSELNVSSDDCKRFIYDHFNNHMRTNVVASFSFKKIEKYDIEQILGSLDPHTSQGLTGISVNILKAISKNIAPFLSKLFNDCKEEAIYLNEWK
ncbi:unnamed protein product [Brachionus calyciflorus]|uniref:Uncharacterized protein n=1 Tax=Brachionus calyciflorus TaxID=104777 RepID=A0A814RLG0_9BILA|nr:unnamed protein product [Brachionus calyciflorus]